MKLFHIGIGGFMGASCRFLLGFLMIILVEKLTGLGNFKTLLTTGFLGAFTTFSTFSFETMMLIEDKSYIMAGINIFSNLSLGLLAVMLGIFAARFV